MSFLLICYKFLSSGVLDSDELSSLGGSLHHHDGILLSSNDRGEEKPMARLPRVSEHVLITKEHGNDTVSFLSRDYNLDQGIAFQPRLSHQERNGYKVCCSRFCMFYLKVPHIWLVLSIMVTGIGC